MADNATPTPKALIVLLNQYFGLKDGQTKAEFVSEVRQLSPGDKADFAAMFEAEGMPVKK